MPKVSPSSGWRCSRSGRRSRFSRAATEIDPRKAARAPRKKGPCAFLTGQEFYRERDASSPRDAENARDPGIRRPRNKCTGEATTRKTVHHPVQLTNKLGVADRRRAAGMRVSCFLFIGRRRPFEGKEGTLILCKIQGAAIRNGRRAILVIPESRGL